MQIAEQVLEVVLVGGSETTGGVMNLLRCQQVRARMPILQLASAEQQSKRTTPKMAMVGTGGSITVGF
jgi:hypothetical protein